MNGYRQYNDVVLDCERYKSSKNVLDYTMKYELNDRMPFGKYKGKRIGSILEIALEYIDWCKENIPSFDIDYASDYASENLADDFWQETYDEKELALRNGLYVFACRYDNHLGFEIYRLQKGDSLWKFFIGEFGHFDGLYDVDPLAYHFIEYYPSNFFQTYRNLPHDSNEKYYNDMISVLAYSQNPIIRYALAYNGMLFFPEKLKMKCFIFNEISMLTDINVNLKGVHRFTKYTERDHSNHWTHYHILFNKKSA